MQGFNACSKIEKAWGKSARVHQTTAQKRYGELLKQIGARHSFRCEQPLYGYRCDFYAPYYMLDVEIDGGYHNDPEVIRSDEERTKALNQHGISVLRFTNDEILINPIGVIKRTQAKILACCKVNRLKKKLRKRWLTEKTDVNKVDPFVPIMIGPAPSLPEKELHDFWPSKKPRVILRKAVATMPEARA